MTISTFTDLCESLAHAGIRVRVVVTSDGPHLACRPKAAITDDLDAGIRLWRDALIGLLAPDQTGQTCEEPDGPPLPGVPAGQACYTRRYGRLAPVCGAPRTHTAAGAWLYRETGRGYVCHRCFPGWPAQDDRLPVVPFAPPVPPVRSTTGRYLAYRLVGIGEAEAYDRARAVVAEQRRPQLWAEAGR